MSFLTNSQVIAATSMMLRVFMALFVTLPLFIWTAALTYPLYPISLLPSKAMNTLCVTHPLQSSLTFIFGMPPSNMMMFHKNLYLVVAYGILAFTLMPLPPGVLGLSSTAPGPPFNSNQTGKFQDTIFAGSRPSLLNFLYISLSRWDFRTLICVSTLTTREPLVLCPRVRAATAQLISPFIALSPSFTLFLYLLTLFCIPSAENLADPILRGDLGSADKMLHPKFMLPDELQQFFFHE
jgi:hypothetical protein